MTEKPKTIYLKDYKPPAWLALHNELTFHIFEDKTIVRAKTRYKRNHKDVEQPVVLNGEHLKLLSLTVDGKKIKYKLDDKSLIFDAPDDEFLLEIETEIDPASNTRLEGLYKSGGNWCTQCEAEGFRTITYYPDRPDVMATFQVRIEADKKTCPVLLSNGNLLEKGDLEDRRHYAIWDDPYPKPCYLFALVAGDLVHVMDTFTTRSGSKVDLRIYVRKGDESQCGHAMESLKKSMKWDEDVYGREYQYEQFNIVAVSDFNMGAMENTSLNIFNTALVLAQQETATDTDFERVEGVIAHEYFHNWTGNRITCRDWFQLSLKEGLTVFRDQEFSADMNSAPVKRIDSVALLRRMQFAEDAGPLAHPVRPDNYIEINNFYTVTVYEKGAEVIRMQRELLGKDKYRKATDLYFDRFDGMAVTCDDFVQCMQDAGGVDLGQFKLWYSQAGTPEITAKGSYDEKTKKYTLELDQHVPPTPGQPVKKPMHMPIRVGLVGPNGHDIVEKTLQLKKDRETFVFENVPARPVPSILRGFSAPVKLKTDLANDDLRFLMVHDSDGFNRWEAGQSLALRMINDMLDKKAAVWPEFLDSMGLLLDQAARPDSDKALLARALTLPDISFIGLQRTSVDPGAIYNARQTAIRAIADKFGDRLEKIYESLVDQKFSADFAARSRRALKNVVLRILDGTGRAKKQYDSASNMTDRVAALAVVADSDTKERAEALADFFRRFEAYPLVIDKWFALQAGAVRAQTVQDVKALKSHVAFNMKNPNRVRSLYAAFGISNPVCFHTASGAGYEFLADGIIELNGINPQIAARMMTPFREWKRYTPDRQALMKKHMQRIASAPKLSPDVYEIVNKSLAA
ncbi:MAG TPA: aminopeptidase N [Patescibacteria group bacterium]|nr:aminopeptidase N [Patescibacteria group bacterium]